VTPREPSGDGGSGRPPEASGARYYDQSGYFDSGGAHLRDPESAFHRYRVRKVLELAGPVAGRRAVDLGCGWGTISFALAREAQEVVGVDFAKTAIDLCRERLREGAAENLRFLQADAADTGLSAGAWDLVVAADLVEHLTPEDTRAVYREAHRLLRPGGRFVLWTPDPGHFLERLRRLGILKADPTHIDYKTMERAVREVEEAGFAIVTARPAESHLPVLRWFERAGMGALPLLRRRVTLVGERVANG
jgi:ubiquinone/menaquinone biosynthesis C-methylase UbiE